jgi:hypothetical protein
MAISLCGALVQALCSRLSLLTTCVNHYIDTDKLQLRDCSAPLHPLISTHECSCFGAQAPPRRRTALSVPQTSVHITTSLVLVIHHSKFKAPAIYPPIPSQKTRTLQGNPAGPWNPVRGRPCTRAEHASLSPPQPPLTSRAQQQEARAGARPQHTQMHRPKLVG